MQSLLILFDSLLSFFIWILIINVVLSWLIGFNILNAQRIATEKIFKSKKIPFRSFYLKKRSEETLGELFCFFTLEVILLSHLLKVNPLDQPEVELVKKETFNILKK